MTIAGNNASQRYRVLLASTTLSLALFQVGCTRFHISHELNPGLASVQQAIAAESSAAPGKHSEVTIVAHRGFGLSSTDGRTVIGNTPTALTRGIASGADWIEIDIRESGDGELVVFHDASIDQRTTGQGRVDELTLSQLRAVDIKVSPPEKIPTVEEVLQQFGNHNLRLILDIKAPGVGEKLLPLVGKYLREDQLILFGRHEILEEYRDAPYPLGLTFLFRKSGNRLRVLAHHSLVIDRAQSLDCDYLVLPIIFANQPLVDAANSSGLEVWIYNSEDEKDWQRSIDRGIRGLIVDSVDSAVRFRNQQTTANPETSARPPSRSTSR